MVREDNRFFFLAFPVLILLISCGGAPAGQQYADQKDKTQTKSKQESRVADSSKLSPDKSPAGNPGGEKSYNTADSLIKLLRKPYNTDQVKKLERICSGSDGEVSESLNAISKELFMIHMK